MPYCVPTFATDFATVYVLVSTCGLSLIVEVYICVSMIQTQPGGDANYKVVSEKEIWGSISS